MFTPRGKADGDPMLESETARREQEKQDLMENELIAARDETRDHRIKGSLAICEGETSTVDVNMARKKLTFTIIEPCRKFAGPIIINCSEITGLEQTTIESDNVVLRIRFLSGFWEFYFVYPSEVRPFKDGVVDDLESIHETQLPVTLFELVVEKRASESKDSREIPTSNSGTESVN